MVPLPLFGGTYDYDCERKSAAAKMLLKIDPTLKVRIGMILLSFFALQGKE
jgi:hypothetical protein